MLSLGSPGPFRRTRVRLRRTRPALAGKLGEGTTFALCARDLLIASNARSGLAPLPPVLPEVTELPPIIVSQTMNPSPPRSGAWIGKLRRSHFPNPEFVP